MLPGIAKKSNGLCKISAKITLANTILRGRVEVERSRGRPARRRLDDVKQRTGLSSNEMWREKEERVAWRKRVGHDAPKGLNSP